MKTKLPQVLCFLLVVLSYNATAARLVIDSTAFDRYGSIPVQFTCNGANISPPLEILDAMGTTKSYTLMVYDRDAPEGDWVHWLMFNIPPSSINELNQGATEPKGAVVGKNSYDKVGYSGPCPASGEHRYAFQIWALDTVLDLEVGATKDEVMKAMEGHMIASSQLIGRYSKARFAIDSAAFKSQDAIPKQFTCNGANIHPPLEIIDEIGTAKSYTLMVYDPDVPNGHWVHWMMFNIPPSAINELNKGASAPTGAVIGKNSYGKVGYSGPCPSFGKRQYYFQIWALDSFLDLDAAATRDEVMKAMEGHVIASSQLVGTYSKP